MKRVIKTLLLFSLLMPLAATTQDTQKWHELVITNQGPYQAKGITVKLFKERYSGLEGQQYTVVFTNICSKTKNKRQSGGSNLLR